MDLVGICKYWTTQFTWFYYYVPVLQGYVPHVLSTVAEWITALAFVLYCLTFHSDFTNVSVEVTILTLEPEPFSYPDRLADGADTGNRTCSTH